MLARDNFSYKKYQKELAKKKKKEEKEQRRLSKKNMNAGEHLAASDGAGTVSAAESTQASDEAVAAA